MEDQGLRGQSCSAAVRALFVTTHTDSAVLLETGNVLGEAVSAALGKAWVFDVVASNFEAVERMADTSYHAVFVQKDEKNLSGEEAARLIKAVASGRQRNIQLTLLVDSSSKWREDEYEQHLFSSLLRYPFSNESLVKATRTMMS